MTSSPRLHRTDCHTAPPASVPVARAHTAVAVTLTDWFSAKPYSQPGIDATGTKIELANTLGKRDVSLTNRTLPCERAQDSGKGEKVLDGGGHLWGSHSLSLLQGQAVAAAAYPAHGTV